MKDRYKQSTVDSATGSGQEASTSQPCPLCGHDHYCYLIPDNQGEISKVICQWTDDPPDGWERASNAKDGRGFFIKQGARRNRRHYPNFIQLQPSTKPDIPEWKPVERGSEESPSRGDLVADKRHGSLYWFEKWEQGRNGLNAILTKLDGISKGTTSLPADDITIATSDTKTGAIEQQIEYQYPSLEGGPLGKVVRRQWSDRRRVYENQRKTKEVRPWYWVGSQDGAWLRGKGDRAWPLYRETEAKEEILRGGIVFAVAGEQAVETYRGLGLTATTCQGGESNWQEFVSRLRDTFQQAIRSKLKPLLVIHPDFDLTGESKFGEQLQRESDFAKIPAVVLNPLALWAETPPGGDIYNLIHESGLPQDAILQALEAEIDAAIDRQEEEARARTQRSRWKAPEAWHGELGQWVEKKDGDEVNRYFLPKTDFDFQVERELISDDGGGLLLQLKRTDDKGQRRIFIKSTDWSTAQKFKDSLKRALGAGIVCNLNNWEVESLIRVRLHEYRITRKGKAYRLVDRVGQQGDGTWVFGDRQFTPMGERTDESQSLWVWNSKLTGEESTLPTPRIADQAEQALKNLVDVMRRAFGSNFLPALLTLGYAAAGVHYQEILDKEGAFPTLNLYGDPGSGKTTAAECALSLVGMHQDGMMCDISLSAAYERLKLAGSLIHCLDDPTRTPELNAFLKGFYNGKARVVRGKEVSFNVQKPHSPMMVTSNHACGENDAATQSRLVRLFFRKSGDGDRDAFYELPAAQKAASGCLTQLIKLGYPSDEVHNLIDEIAHHLPHAHIRIAKSLALLLCYAQKVAALAEAPEDLRRYVLEVVCTAVNSAEEDGDSIRDFLEKLYILQAQSKVGEWNFREVGLGEDSRLAIHLPSVWAAIDKEFSPPYNRKIIESLLTAAGVKEGRQRFHRNEDESKAYHRALLTSGDSVSPPEDITRRCHEIPIALLREYGEKNLSTMSTELEKDAETPATTSPFPLTNECQLNVNEIEICQQTPVPTEGGEGQGIPVDKTGMSTEAPVDMSLSTDSKPVRARNTASKKATVDIVDKKNTSKTTEGNAYPHQHPHTPPPPLSELPGGYNCWVFQLSDGSLPGKTTGRRLERGQFSIYSGKLKDAYKARVVMPGGKRATEMTVTEDAIAIIGGPGDANPG